MRDIALACRLAAKDWWFEKLLSACGVLALASVLAPLLILFGVRYGVISALQERLLHDPAILTITPLGSGAGFDDAWFETIRARPGTRFVVPRTRDIAATMQIARTDAGREKLVRVSLEPTGPGDPLLERFVAVPPDADSLVLSASAARKLGLTAEPPAAGTGGTGASAPVPVQGELGRQKAGGGLESASWPLRVTAVLPPEAEERDVAFVLLPLMNEAEQFRDHLAVPRRGLAGAAPVPEAERRYAGFRLVAASLDEVAPLAAFVQGQGLEVNTRARDIAVVTDLDRSLTLIFTLIAVTAAAGCAASTASSVLATVRRKDKQLGMLRLVGFSGPAIMAYPLAQAQLTGLVGTLAAFLVYVAVSAGIDRLFGAALAGLPVCRMEAAHAGAALLLVLVLTGASALRAAIRAARIEPSDVLRDI